VGEAPPPGAGRVRVERQRAVESRRRHRRLAGQVKQRPGSLQNRVGVIALGFERLPARRQASLMSSCDSAPTPEAAAEPDTSDYGRRRRVGRIDRQRLSGEDDHLGKVLFGEAIRLRQSAR